MIKGMNLYQIPEWFYMYSVFLQFLFAIVTTFVSYYSYKVYKISEERDARLFSFSFLFISLSYWSWLCLSFFVLEPIGRFTYSINIETASFIDFIPIYLHLAFFIVGLATLAYKRLNIQNNTVYFLILSLVLPFLFVAYRKVDFTYIIATILLIFITSLYIRDYIKNKNKSILILAFSFFLILISSICFIFGDNNPIFYVAGHIFLSLGYIIILTKLLIIIKNEWKKTK